MPIYGFNAPIDVSLFTEGITKGPGTAAFRGEPGLDQGSPLNEWWR